MIFGKLALASVGLALGATVAFADSTIRVLHVNDNGAAVELWNKIARDFEAQNKGVKVDVQYLENEAFKAKLPTLLQSEERPSVIYSWGGGVMRAQAKAGFLSDISADGAPWA